MESLAEAVTRVRERIASACARSGRQLSAVQLLPVTKVFPASVIRAAYEQGFHEFGENYVQEFEGKEPALRDLADTRYHLIGHLQSNKARRAAELFQVVQTVDSAKLARRLDEAARSLARRIDCLIEVKLSHEESKWGVAPEDLAPLVEGFLACENLNLTGLMTVPEWSEDPENPRPVFAQLRELAARHKLPQLSMGMSNDFEAAIEEGATIIRLGTALFGRRQKP